MNECTSCTLLDSWDNTLLVNLGMARWQESELCGFENLECTFLIANYTANWCSCVGRMFIMTIYDFTTNQLLVSLKR